MRVKGKIAIVVGGASGIAKAASKLLAKEGAKVMIADLDIENANKVVDEIRMAGGDAAAIKVDMTKVKETEAMAKATLDTFGGIDILVNVAGGSKGKYIRDEFGPFCESTKDMWDRIIDINLNGARNCTRAVINHMIEKGSGKIVNMSSLAGVQGVPGAVDYSAAKAGIIGFTKALAKEVTSLGIQVNCISPGGVATERLLKIVGERKKEGILSLEPDKMARPEEIGNIILLLVSGEVEHLVGENIVVAGLDNNSDRI